jgi:hypothetical protein
MKWIDRHWWPLVCVCFTLAIIGLGVIAVLQLGLDLGWWEDQ